MTTQKCTLGFIPFRTVGPLLAAFTLTAAVLGGCNNDSDHDNPIDTTPGILGDGVGGVITDTLTDDFTNYAHSKFLGLIGIKPESPEEKQLDEVLDDITQIQTQLDKMQADLNTLLGDFLNLQEQLNNDASQAEYQLLNTIQTKEYANWNQFQNAVYPNTLAELVQNNKALDALKALFTDAYFNQIASQSAELSDTADSSSAVPALLGSSLNLLKATIATGSNSQQNIVPLFAQYNEGLMQQLYYISQALQQIYTLEQTLLYLQEYAPGDYGAYFQGLTLGEPGIYGNNTYAQNSQALHDLFQQRAAGLKTLFSQFIVSDAKPADLTAPTAAATLPGIVEGSWTGACGLYVWDGYTDLPVFSFNPYNFPAGNFGSWNDTTFTPKTSWDGQTLTAYCETGWQQWGTYTTINTATQCQKPPSLNDWLGTLQCTNINPKSVSAPAWNGSVGATFAGQWYSKVSVLNSSYITFDVNVFTNPPSATPISGPLTQSNGNWSVTVGNLHASNSTVWQYDSQGFVGAFAVLINETNPTIKGDVAYEVQIQCIAGDKFCKQLNSADYSNNSAICLAGRVIYVVGAGPYGSLEFVLPGGCSL